jgi:AcrR family transcriptional regulator
MTRAGAPPLRDRILERALELFNERGIEYVGVRELARDLGIQAGNISYHFPTKDDLVRALGLGLRDLNDATIRLPKAPSLEAFMEMFRQVFRNHHRYRCLFLSLSKLLAPGEALAGLYVGTTEVDRRRVIFEYLLGLQEAGLLRPELAEEELRRLVSFCGLVSRGWIADARVSLPDASPGWQMDHYLHILVDHLEGHATPEGRRELARFRDSLEGREG